MHFHRLTSTPRLATCLHHILILSPNGQYLVKLIDGVHSLTPYAMIKQTLKVANAATMIHAMMQIFLAKINPTSLLNRASKHPSEAGNLLQTYVPPRNLVAAGQTIG